MVSREYPWGQTRLGAHMRTTLAWLGLVLATSGCFTRGNGEAASSVRDVGEFHAVDLGGVFQAEITVGPATHVELRGDGNLLDKVELQNIGGELRAELRGSVLPTMPLRLLVSTPTLDAVDLSGASQATITGATGPKLELEISGASNVTVAGAVDSLELDLSGASQADAARLVAKQVQIDASGASSAEVVANESFDADASGASNVTWRGDATRVTTDASGAASITKR